MLNSVTQSDAELTAAIAIDTKHDSIAMKTISILGIVFLPGTFMATLFSVDMFQWEASDGDSNPSLRVSPSMWIYWATTVPLTAVVVLIWMVWSWKAMSRSNKRLASAGAILPRESASSTSRSMNDAHEKMV